MSTRRGQPQNLAALSGLDLLALHDAVEGNDPGAVITATERANTNLERRLAQAWQQSKITVRLSVDGGTLHVLVKTDGPRYSKVAEHSDGLKTFLALTAFSHNLVDQQVPLVLLIDEAEQHLHYDAQADLIRMLERQSLADQVVYSTHSAGCLPSDLGTGIRGVIPGITPGRSVIANSLWQAGPGFTPLLMALGAGAAAFAPSRYAALGEGATEMLLLPSLIREAIGNPTRLDYQVAAGLAEVGNRDLHQLELEAPRVVYVVDGDTGGNAHATRLRRSGVEATRIVQIGGPSSGLSIEDVIREDLYLAAVNDVLANLGAQQTLPKAALTKGPTRTAAVSAWCTDNGVPKPGKPAVAVALLEASGEQRLLTRDGARRLRDLHEAICTALDLPTRQT